MEKAFAILLMDVLVIMDGKEMIAIQKLKQIVQKKKNLAVETESV